MCVWEEEETREGGREIGIVGERKSDCELYIRTPRVRESAHRLTPQAPGTVILKRPIFTFPTCGPYKCRLMPRFSANCSDNVFLFLADVFISISFYL